MGDTENPATDRENINKIEDDEDLRSELLQDVSVNPEEPDGIRHKNQKSLTLATL